MAEHEKSVLFLCTGNSARSLLAECLLQRLGQGRFRAFSAGSQPKAAPHPQALALLRDKGHATANLRSKSWDEFVGPGSPAIDLVVTLCDAAAAEACPRFPGSPARLHWSIDDPAGATGPEAEVRAEFLRAYDALERRIEALVRGSA